MSTQTLRSVAQNVVDQYSLAGKQLVRAYRAGTERAVGAVNERFASVVNARSLPLVTDTVKTSLIDAQQQVAGFVSFGLGLGANGADITIDQLSRRVSSGIERVSGAGTRVESALGTSALDKIGAVALPLAHVTLEIANVVAEGSKRLSDRVAGVEQAPAPARKAAAKKRARRTTRRA
jgi:hypothetical protein